MSGGLKTIQFKTGEHQMHIGDIFKAGDGDAYWVVEMSNLGVAAAPFGKAELFHYFIAAGRKPQDFDDWCKKLCVLGKAQ